MYPTLEQAKELAASGEYKRIPVCRELYADRFTPIEVMRTLRAARIGFSRARAEAAILVVCAVFLPGGHGSE